MVFLVGLGRFMKRIRNNAMKHSLFVVFTIILISLTSSSCPTHPVYMDARLDGPLNLPSATSIISKDILWALGVSYMLWQNSF